MPMPHGHYIDTWRESRDFHCQPAPQHYRERTMAKVLTTEARVAKFVIDDLRRRRLQVDELLKELGLRKRPRQSGGPPPACFGARANRTRGAPGGRCQLCPAPRRFPGHP
jgi:hypothetical protein